VTEGEQLLRAVLEEPGDDTVRLVYADWLEENGRGKEAAYIRNGVAICHPERLNPEHDMGAGWDGIIDFITQYPPADRNHCPLCRAISHQRGHPFTRALAADVGDIFGKPADWSGRKDPGVPNYVGVRCRGGFVAEVTTTAAQFTEEVARSLFSRHPVTAVCLTDARPSEDSAIGSTRVGWHLAEQTEDVDETDPGMGYIPLRIFERLTRMVSSPVDAYNLGLAVYQREADARGDLSDACCLWGRSLVKPPLKSLETKKNESVSERISS
jgi:uncharacterized protein (TIGR02996 family)